MPKKKVDAVVEVKIQPLPEIVNSSHVEDKVREIIKYLNENG